MVVTADTLGYDDSTVSNFNDSTALLGQPDLLRAAFEHDGYVLIRGVLDPTEVDDVQTQLLSLATEHGWTRRAGNGEVRPNPDAACFEGDPTYDAVYQEMWSRESFHRLLHAKPALEIVESLLGEKPFVHPRKVLRFVFPQSKTSRSRIAGWHQDYPEIQGSERTLTLWTPLARCDADSGALALLPGSHRNGLLPLRLSGTPIGWEADCDDVADIHTGLMEPGDVLVFGAFTVHRGTPNSADRFRLSVDCRYQPVSDPVSEYCLELVGAGYGWDDVYRDWARTDLQHYWRDLPLNVVPFDTRWEDWRDEAALSGGRLGDPRARKALELAVKFSEWIEVREEAAALLEAQAAGAA